MKAIANKSISLFLLSLIFFGCDFNQPQTGPRYPIPEEPKPYILFPKGSYWIYEERNSSSIDSVYLYRSETEEVDAVAKLGYNFENYIAGYKSSFTGDSTRGFGAPFLSDETKWSYKESVMNTPLFELTLTFLHPVTVGESRRYAEDFALIYESFAEAQDINGVTYYSVMVFKHNIMIQPNQAERIFYAKNVGVIRRELFNGEVWQLKKYFINK
jgi:hypothetical protein